MVVLLKNLKKAHVYLKKFYILKIRSNKKFLSDINDTIFKAFYNNPDFTLTFNIDIFSNKTKKDLKNTQLKLIEKKTMCKFFAWFYYYE